MGNIKRSPRRDIIRLDPQVLDRLMAEHKLNNSMLAEMTGVVRATASLWRNGGGIPLDQAQKLASLFNVSVGDLLSAETKEMFKALLQTQGEVVVTLPRKIFIKHVISGGKRHEEEQIAQAVTAVIREFDTIAA